MLCYINPVASPAQVHSDSYQDGSNRCELYQVSLSPLQGELVYLRVPRVETWAEPCSHFWGKITPSAPLRMSRPTQAGSLCYIGLPECRGMSARHLHETHINSPSKTSGLALFNRNKFFAHRVAGVLA
jgi:hypothetical protein